MGETGSGATVHVDPGGKNERIVVIDGRLFIGRECPGVPENSKVIVDDATVSRSHAEIRVAGTKAVLLDTSTNGTRLNGLRIERAVATPLHDGDRIRVGDTDMEFRAGTETAVRGEAAADTNRTRAFVAPTPLILVVGDIIGYSTMSQHAPSEVVAESLDSLYGALRVLLAEQKGTFVSYVGDAFFAYWEPEIAEDAALNAAAFAMSAGDCVAKIGPTLSLSAHGDIAIGWAIVHGLGTVSSINNTPMTVLGDATNLAFRLSGVSGRDGRTPVVITENLVPALQHAYELSPAEDVAVKGRSGTERLHELIRPRG